MNDPSSRPSPRQSTHQAERVIARAFWISLIVAVLVAGIILVVLLSDSKPEQNLVDQAAAAPEEAVAEVILPTQAVFVDVTDIQGIDFKHDSGAIGDRMLPETMGGGVAFADLDDDGDSDIVLLSGHPWPWDSAVESSSFNSLAVYRNNGAGQFSPWTINGLQSSAYVMGSAIADYDSDGDLDIYLTNLLNNQLFRNDGSAGFTDVTEEAGVAGRGDWSTGAVWTDVDGDQDSDLVVVNYVKWSREIDLKADYQLAGIGRAYGPPNNFEGSHAELFINLGNGRFEERSAEQGLQVTNPASGVAVAKSLAVVATDLDQDGDIDLFVANDTTRNFALINDGKGQFSEQGEVLGLSYDNMGKSTGAMGVDVFSGPDGLTHVAVGNFANEMTSLYRLDPVSGSYADDAAVLGIGAASRSALTFGLLFLDYDLDGRQDLFQVNGHVEDEINRVQPSQHHAQPPQLFWNCGPSCPRQFTALTTDQLGALATPLIGRGVAYADIDSDGDLDLLIGQAGGSARLFRNETESGHWIRLDVRKSDAITRALDCRARLTSPHPQQRRFNPTRSYLSQVEWEVTFGLGDHSDPVTVEVDCPDGSKTTFEQLSVDQLHRLTMSSQ